MSAAGSTTRASDATLRRAKRASRAPCRASRGRRSRPAGWHRSLRSGAREGFLRRRLHRRHQGPASRTRSIEDALAILCNLEHRGAVGADPRAGDGAGILVQIPHKFFAKKADTARLRAAQARRIRRRRSCSCRAIPDWRQIIRDIYAQMIKREGMTLLGWREVPTDNSTLGEIGQADRARAPAGVHRARQEDQERGRVRAAALHPAQVDLATRSTRARSGGCRAITRCRSPAAPSCYKGMFLADQLGTYYPDLHDEDFESALALVHQRFSTNTFPTWSLAHPYRMIAHNGEINTLRGNSQLDGGAPGLGVLATLFGDDINKLWPISYEGQSDTACFDNALEFLTQGGYSLAHAVMMMIPEAWAGNPLMDEERRAFYEYNAALMEPWDGPAAIAFTNGRQIGATLDRNGLRPARYFVTRDQRIIMASEMGVLAIPEKDIVTEVAAAAGQDAARRPRPRPPHSRRGAQVDARQEPSLQGVARAHQIVLEDLPAAASEAALSNLALLDRQQAFGYTQEDLRILMTPMASTGRGGGRLDGQRYADLGAVRHGRSCSSPISSRTSRR